MTLTAWRIVKRQHASSAFSGEGARLNGGRWSSPGAAVVYTAGSIALAALEMLTHLDDADALHEYCLLPARLDDRLVGELTAPLPADWTAPARRDAVRSLGDAWLREGSTAVLRVPSAVVPQEINYLLNPGHHDFGGIEIGGPEPFSFDRRLLRTR